MSEYESGCPVFRAEARMMAGREGALAIRGFAAAHLDEPNTIPSDCHCNYEKKAWQHGYNCYKERIFPWGLEVKVYAARASREQQEMSDRDQAIFKQTGKLPEKVLAVLEKTIKNQICPL